MDLVRPRAVGLVGEIDQELGVERAAAVRPAVELGQPAPDARIELAVAELVANAGHQFDPRVVAAFLRMTERADPAVDQALGRDRSSVTGLEEAQIWDELASSGSGRLPTGRFMRVNAKRRAAGRMPQRGRGLCGWPDAP